MVIAILPRELRGRLSCQKLEQVRHSQTRTRIKGKAFSNQVNISLGQSLSFQFTHFKRLLSGCPDSPLLCRIRHSCSELRIPWGYACNHMIHDRHCRERIAGLIEASAESLRRAILKGEILDRERHSTAERLAQMSQVNDSRNIRSGRYLLEEYVAGSYVIMRHSKGIVNVYESFQDASHYVLCLFPGVCII